MATDYNDYNKSCQEIAEHAVEALNLFLRSTRTIAASEVPIIGEALRLITYRSALKYSLDEFNECLTGLWSTAEYLVKQIIDSYYAIDLPELRKTISWMYNLLPTAYSAADGLTMTVDSEEMDAPEDTIAVLRKYEDDISQACNILENDLQDYLKELEKLGGWI